MHFEAVRRKLRPTRSCSKNTSITADPIKKWANGILPTEMGIPTDSGRQPSLPFMEPSGGASCSSALRIRRSPPLIPGTHRNTSAPTSAGRMHYVQLSSCAMPLRSAGLLRERSFCKNVNFLRRRAHRMSKISQADVYLIVFRGDTFYPFVRKHSQVHHIGCDHPEPTLMSAILAARSSTWSIARDRPSAEGEISHSTKGFDEASVEAAKLFRRRRLHIHHAEPEALRLRLYSRPCTYTFTYECRRSSDT